MNGRERLTNAVLGRATDRIPWTILMDEKTRINMPDVYKNMPANAFYRNLGCDIMQFGLWTSEFGLANPGYITFPETYESSDTDAQGMVTVTCETPWGLLKSSHKNGHPISYPIKTKEDLVIYRSLWLNAKVIYNDKSRKLFADCETDIGADGLCVCTTLPSPVQMLLETEIGIENFYYLLEDYPDAMTELLQIMHDVRLQEYRLNAQYSEQLIHIPIENTSTSYISPEIYRKYSLPQIRDYVEILHGSGKKVIVHMCGLLDQLLPFFNETGMDGIHALTEKPIGDTSMIRVLDEMGDDTVMMTVLNGNTFLRSDVSKVDIFRLLEQTLTPRIRSANIVLVVAADGLPTPIDNFRYVQEWMERYGKR
jgi:hypothetical protein